MKKKLAELPPWNEISNEQDMKLFLESISYFHDSCIKEIRYYSGAFVNSNLRMHPVADDRKLFVAFQCQSKDLPMVEIEFIGLKCLRLFPLDDTFTSEILGATMFIDGGEVYWCDYDGVGVNEFDSYIGTAIRAESCRWRIIGDSMGSKMFYKSEYDDMQT